MARFLLLLAVFPYSQPVAILLTAVVTFFAAWIGAVEAQRLRELARTCAPGRGDDRGHHRRCPAIPALLAGAADHAPGVGGRAGACAP